LVEKKDLSGPVRLCMNIDSDNTQRTLLWLLEKFDPTFSIPSGNRSTSAANLKEAGSFGVGSDATSSKPIHQQGSKAAFHTKGLAPNLSTSSRAVSLRHDATSPSPRFSVASRDIPVQDEFSQTAQSFNFGEIHAVQERFQSLLKQRLLMEYENNPPLFPWENEVSEYPDVADSRSSECIPATSMSAPAMSALWGKHISSLKVPGLLPEPVLSTLFERCQEIARSSSKQGIRLVRAVETLFPEQLDILAPIADMVLVPAYRSDSETQAAVTQELVNVAGEYDSAKPEQQVALSMLAAQEILSALTLSLSETKPYATKDWVTPVGILKLSATYKQLSNPGMDQKQLTVVAVLPDAGSVRLWDGELEKSARRVRPGAVDVTLIVADSSKPCFLEVALDGDASPLSFSVQLVDE